MITLETLDSATAQEVFNQVATHLLHQNEMSRGNINGHMACLYRFEKDNGTVLMCAGGCLMSDEEAYKVGLSDSWASLVNENKVPGKHSVLITELQWVHDLNAPGMWASLLYTVAKTNNLTTEVLAA